MYVTINEDEHGRAFEVFVQMGKAGGCPMSHMAALGKTISVALRSGAEINEIARHLVGTRCIRPVNKVMGKGQEVLSCADGMGRIMAEYQARKMGVKPQKQTEIPQEPIAPYPQETTQDVTVPQSGPTPPGEVEVAPVARPAQDLGQSEHHGSCPACRVGVMVKRHGRSCDRCDRCGYSECE
jgi:ribonucleoside-diphosphate reductase alpha chain